MSGEQFLHMVNYEPELHPILNEALKIWDAQLSQLQHPQIQQQPQGQQAANQQQQIPIPENLNSENDSYSVSEQDDPVHLVFGIRRNITILLCMAVLCVCRS